MLCEHSEGERGCYSGWYWDAFSGAHSWSAPWPEPMYRQCRLLGWETRHGPLTVFGVRRDCTSGLSSVGLNSLGIPLYCLGRTVPPTSFILPYTTVGSPIAPRAAYANVMCPKSHAPLEALEATSPPRVVPTSEEKKKYTGLMTLLTMCKLSAWSRRRESWRSGAPSPTPARHRDSSP